MTNITREIWIDAPVEQVWDALADFGNIYQFNPSVPQSYLTSDQKTGVGTTRHCDLSTKDAYVEERIIEWVDNEMMKIEIIDGQKVPPWKSAFATINVNSERGGTRVSGVFEYKMKMGPIGGLMSVLLIQPQFGKAWGALFAGLKHFVETGNQVENSRQLDLTPVVVVA